MAAIPENRLNDDLCVERNKKKAELALTKLLDANCDFTKRCSSQFPQTVSVTVTHQMIKNVSQIKL